MPPGPKPKAPKANAADLLKPPSWLPEDVRPTWNAVVPLAAGEIKLSRVDVIGLADLCTCLFRMQQAEERISDEGVTTRDKAGIVRKHPCVQIARDYRASLQNWCRMYGWTPTHKRYVDVAKESDKTPPEGFLAEALEKIAAGRP